MLAELALDKGDELVGGHGVEFDPLAELARAPQQEFDLRSVEAWLMRRRAAAAALLPSMATVSEASGWPWAANQSMSSRRRPRSITVLIGCRNL